MTLPMKYLIRGALLTGLASLVVLGMEVFRWWPGVDTGAGFYGSPAFEWIIGAIAGVLTAAAAGGVVGGVYGRVRGTLGSRWMLLGGLAGLVVKGIAAAWWVWRLDLLAAASLWAQVWLVVNTIAYPAVGAALLGAAAAGLAWSPRRPEADSEPSVRGGNEDAVLTA